MIQSFLRSVPLFAELSDQDLARICESVSETTLEAGTVLFEEGAAGDSAYIVRDGLLEIYKQSGKREVMIAHRGRGEIIGEMALFEDTPRTASVRAKDDTALIEITREQFDHLIKTSRHAAETLFYTVLSRLRAIQSQLRQSEKMAQLGTLSAGMAHELNNPAAAVRRGSGQLVERFEAWAELERELAGFGLDAAQLEALNELRDELRSQAASPFEMDTLARADLQEQLESGLAGLGIDDAWQLAPELVDLGLGVEELVDRLGLFEHRQRPGILRWLLADTSIHRLLYEVQQGAERISGIVAAMKSYAYLDQAPSQEVDLHKGLNDTLVILGSKIKETPNLSIHKEFDPELPKIYGYGSELNQVWTNLIDNALDAVEDGGEITLRTKAFSDHVVIEVEDTGPGIPEAIQERVFEAFFTTKPPGKGTGLGLDISYNIVALKHMGSLTFTSAPGKTVFKVELPLDFTKT